MRSLRLYLGLLVACRAPGVDDKARDAFEDSEPAHTGALETGHTGETGETGVSPEALTPWTPRVVERPMVYGLGPPDSAEEADTLAERAVSYGVGMMIPSIGGYYVLWQTDRAPYDPDHQALLDAGTDVLVLQIEAAHAAGVGVYPSVTVYNSAPLAAEHPEWITRDSAGDPNPSDALAFSYPDARAEKIALFLDLVCAYDVDGVFLDYMRYPSPEYGYDEPVIEECISEHGFDPRDVDADSPEYTIFAEIRARSVTEFVTELREAALACAPNLRIGGFGGPDPVADATDYGRDYTAWSQTGAIDDLFLAVYDDPLDEHRQIVADNRAAVGDEVRLLSSLASYYGFLSTEDELLSAAREQIMGGADGLWIYREDYLTSQDLWGAAEKAGDRLEQILGSTPTLEEGWSADWSVEGEMSDQDGCLRSGGAFGRLLSPMTPLLLLDSPWAIAVKVEPLGDLDRGAPDGLALRWASEDGTWQLAPDRAAAEDGGTEGGLLLGGPLAMSAPRVVYDAAEVEDARPDEVSPLWEPDGSAADPAMVWDAGDTLAVRFASDVDTENAGDYGGWLSPFHPHAVLRAEADYTVAATVQPRDDLVSAGYSYEAPNIHLAWAEQERTCVIAFDLDGDDSGDTLGRVVATAYPMETLAELDWSSPREISVEHDAGTDLFTLSIDGMETALIAPETICGATYATWQGRAHFGDSTTGGHAPDYDADWVRVSVTRDDAASLGGVDWSTSHVLAVSWHPDDSRLYFYVDGLPVDYATLDELNSDTDEPDLAGRISFGDLAGDGPEGLWCGAGVYSWE